MLFRILSAALIAAFSTASHVVAQQPSTPSSRTSWSALNALAGNLSDGGREREAEPLYRRALAQAEREFGPDDPRTLTSANNLALSLKRLERYAEAERLYLRALDGRRRVLGANHGLTIQSLHNLGALYEAMGHYDRAEPLLRRTYEMLAEGLGRDNRDTLITQLVLASSLMGLARFEEAERLYSDLLPRQRALFGEGERTTTTAIRIAQTRIELGRAAEAETLLRRLATTTANLDIPESVRLLIRSSLASALAAQSRYSEAETENIQVIERRRQLLGPDDPSTLASMDRLATVYQAQRRYLESARLLEQVLAGYRRRLGPESPDALISATNLAQLYLATGRYTRADALLSEALPISRRTRAADHFETLTLIGNLADLRYAQGRFNEAESLYREVLTAYRRIGRETYPNALTSAANLALLLGQRGQWQEAERMMAAIVELSGRSLSPDDPVHVGRLANLAFARLHIPGLEASAVAPARQAFQSRRRVYADRDIARTTSDQGFSTQEPASAAFTLLPDAIFSSTARDPIARARQRGEAFEALQLPLSEGDRSVVHRSARRLIEREHPAFSAVMERRDRAEAQVQTYFAQASQRFAGASRPGDGNDSRAQGEALIRTLADIDRQLAAQYPGFAAYVQPQPVGIAALQAALGPDEALLLIMPADMGLHVFVVTRDAVAWERANASRREIRLAVQRLRMDLGAAVEGDAEPAEPRGTGQNGRSFDRRAAFDLYQRVIGPIARMLEGKRRLVIVADGPLATLPFSVLVTQTPTGRDDDPAALRSTQWFSDRIALSHMPSVQTFLLLREARTLPSAATGSFFGVGDPALAGRSQQRRFREPQARSVIVALPMGGLRGLARLEGTRAELEAMKRALGAPGSALLLGTEATETQLRRRAADIGNARILAFATHGLLAGDIEGIGEPGLVLTPPAVPGPLDDGYLSASEIAGMRLQADWVILSACNTAAGARGTPARGLGPISRAFFFAGAKSLLGSHWPVSDDVAPILTVRTLTLGRGGLSRAEALQQAMREVRMDRSRDASGESRAHPYYWAPFVLIGDGR